MKVLITGAGGFIGSHLADACVKQGDTVRALIHYNSRNNWGWLDRSEVREDLDVVTGDIRDYDSVRDAVEGCDTVLHLAALIGIPYSYVSPLAYIRTNVEGTYNVLQVSRDAGVSNILTTSTSEIYGTAQYIPIDEKHPLVGQSPYSATKIAADQLAISFYRSFDLPVKIVRPFNTYGPRQSARAVIPTVVTQLLKGGERIRLGNLAPTRDLTYVKDTVGGFFEILKADGLYGEVTNIGMNEETSVGDLVGLISDIMGKKVTVDVEDVRVRAANSEVERLRCDNSKIMSKTGWKPSYSLRSGLAETIEWISRNLDVYKEKIYNI